jgi:hypothetical protein
MLTDHLQQLSSFEGRGLQYREAVHYCSFWLEWNMFSAEYLVEDFVFELTVSLFIAISN